MPAYEAITSFQNPKIKQVKRLREHRDREREGLFVIDAARDLSRALAQGYTIAYALVCPTALSAEDRPLLDQLPPARIYAVPPDMLAKIAYRDNPSALVAVLEQKPRLGITDLAQRYPHLTTPILALVNLQKPGNIGALLRTADAAGFSMIGLIDTALDIYNPNVIRSSTGACFLDTVFYLSTAEALRLFRQQKYVIVAAAVAGDVPLFAADFRRQVALVLGTEDLGLDAIWLKNADLRVQIPMVGQLSDSLNVSVAGAIFMYEVLRQQQI